MIEERLAILAEGLFSDHHAKTAHGVIRYGQREVVAVIDSQHAGEDASEVVPFCLRPVPIVASLAEAVDRGATCLLIGVAPTGGKLDADWRALLLQAVEAGLDLEAGLHNLLADDVELRKAAEARGAARAGLAAWAREAQPGPPDRPQRGLGCRGWQEGGHA